MTKDERSISLSSFVIRQMFYRAMKLDVHWG
jgi:hypothetical protein